MRWKQPSPFVLAALLAAGCGNLTDDTTAVVSAVLGDRLPGLQGDADLLAEASDAFNAFEDANDGLGPIFNAQACGQCHTNGAIGGAGEQIERRFGRFDNGVFNPLATRADRCASCSPTGRRPASTTRPATCRSNANRQMRRSATSAA